MASSKPHIQSSLDLLRAEMRKTARQDREQASEYIVSTGTAFLSSLIGEYSTPVMPPDHCEPMYQTTIVADEQCWTFSIQHIVTSLQMSGVEIHEKSTAEDSVSRYGCTNGSWLRRITSTTGLVCHLQKPAVTATYAELLRKLCTPLGSAGGTYASMINKPAHTNFGNLEFFTELLAQLSSCWMEDAALVRALLIADACAPLRQLLADPIWPKIACDGDVINVEQETMDTPIGPFNQVRVKIAAVTLDTWAKMRNGTCSGPAEWDPGHWGRNVAIIPIETCMLQNESTWIYLLAFITTRLWNGLHLYNTTIRPNTKLSAENPLVEYVVAKCKPLATNVVVDGPSRILLVLTNVTSSLGLHETYVVDTRIPVWNPSQAREVQIHWPDAWSYLMKYTATGSSVQRALYLVAEAARNLDLGFCSNPAMSFPVYAMRLKPDLLPALPGVKFINSNWGDASTDIRAAIITINAHNVYPHGFHPSLWVNYKITDEGTRDILTLTSVDGSDISCRCHHSSPDMLIARFLGLIASGPTISFSHVSAVHENISAIAAFQCVGTAWMQAAAGVSWVTWALKDIQEGYQMCDYIVDEMIDEATVHHVARVDPGETWANYVISCFGVDNRTSSTLLSWWAIKYIMQKMNYFIPAQIQKRQLHVGHQLRIGLYFNSSSEWQALQRATSCITVHYGVPVYATNSSEFGIASEFLLLSTCNVPDTNTDDVHMEETWSSPWWDWLLTGVKAANLHIFDDNLPAPLRSFLYERSNLTSTLEKQEASEYGAQMSAQHITSAEMQTKTADREALHEAEKGPIEPCGTVDPRLSAHQRLHELTKFVGNSLDCERFIQGSY
ncbi:unnamed protein product [Gongylonema pulchrum]|uniref:HET domain-containing protein n=1 Tax=Gongylonema pulchrum TaxID=637853 RepID=A0A183E0H9_9BILA|nr:unnamed protein product [Gongylonema pulchrum]